MVLQTTLAVLGLCAILCGAVQARVESTFSPARPPAIPLAVRSPYLNTWLNGDPNGTEHGYLAGRWPQFWTESVNGWQGLIRVDGETYNWMGAEPGYPVVDQVALSYTSTRSNFIMQVGGKVEMNITFMSPVYPHDLRKQSMTHSYLHVAVRSLDQSGHSVQLYADVTSEWASPDEKAIVDWEEGKTDGIVFHKFYRRHQLVFSETKNQADWGNWYWATADGSGVTSRVGAASSVRRGFAMHGDLSRLDSVELGHGRDKLPAFAFAQHLDIVDSDSEHVLFTIGYAQDTAIKFLGREKHPKNVPSFWTQYMSELSMLSDFYHDYSKSLRQMIALDDSINADSRSAGGQDYATITSLTVRQVFGALQFTGTEDRPLVFLKEISSNSDIQTVDVIYPASPILLYLNPYLLKYCLDPLLENQEGGHYPRTSAIHDLGRFPNATGYPDGNDEPMPLEESGNMVILMLAYAQRAADPGYLKRHWPALLNWTKYLIEDAKIPAEQLSTDDFAGHLVNQTNLAIKGIIALKAMAQVGQLTDREDKARLFDVIADEYLDFWVDHGVNANASPPHTNLQYDKPDTHGLLYNLYADRLLNLSFVPQWVYDMQSDYYPTIQRKYGVPLDTRNTWTKSDWEMFAAAIAGPRTQRMFIETLAEWINETPTYRAMTDLFMVDTGAFPPRIQFTARPVMGGAFALLALDDKGQSVARVDVDEGEVGTSDDFEEDNMAESEPDLGEGDSTWGVEDL